MKFILSQSPDGGSFIRENDIDEDKIRLYLKGHWRLRRRSSVLPGGRGVLSGRGIEKTDGGYRATDVEQSHQVLPRRIFRGHT
jgi:hypothetical protein